jgi:transcription antitermination factor NusG
METKTTPWQIISVRAGQETRVARALENVEGIEEVQTPPQQDGRRALSGYIAVRAVLNAELAGALRRVSGVRAVIGESPELHKMFIEAQDITQGSETLNIGDGVHVTDGAMQGLYGVVESILSDGRYQVSLDVFGRSTLCEMQGTSLQRS